MSLGPQSLTFLVIDCEKFAGNDPIIKMKMQPKSKRPL